MSTNLRVPEMFSAVSFSVTVDWKDSTDTPSIVTCPSAESIFSSLSGVGGTTGFLSVPELHHHWLL